MNPDILAVLGVIVLLFLTWFFYINPAQKIVARRRRSKQLAVVQNCRISESALRSLTYRFIDGEDTVYWADRQHPIVFWQRGGVLFMIGCLMLPAAAAAARYGHGFHYTALVNGRHVRRQLSFGWLWIPCLCLAVIVFIASWVEWLRWRSVYRIITNQHLINVIQPWAWAFWLWKEGLYDPQPLTSIVSVAPDDETGGRIFNYGTVKVKVPSMEAPDAALDIHYLPDYEEFATRLDNLRVEAKERAGELTSN